MFALWLSFKGESACDRKPNHLKEVQINNSPEWHMLLNPPRLPLRSSHPSDGGEIASPLRILAFGSLREP
ncbi:MAG: hypothetical protein AAFU53_13320 [Cyanobacteria bacterium J06632_3]